MASTDTFPGPITTPSDDTTGSDTERNYRYQHAYGVILLTGSAMNQLPYIAIYAEHHEDFICERLDRKVDGYQIKTRDPKDGEWTLSHEPIKKSIKRFVDLNKAFSESICSLYFVSNSDYSDPGFDISDQQKLRRSPIKFLKIIKEKPCVEEIPVPFDVTFQEIKEYCNCSADELFLTLRKVDLIKGPGRDSFDAEILATHLGAYSDCANYPMPTLIAIRDELIHRVYLASHKVEAPSKHWFPVYKVSSENPYITAKRVPVGIVGQIIQDKANPPFRYCEGPTIGLGNGKGNLTILRKKMEMGGLSDQTLTMERRSISAEQYLMEFALRNSRDTDAYLGHLESVVQAECAEAYLHASLNGIPFGRRMLDDVYSRLKLKANEGNLVFQQPYEILVGITGLLTGECKVWWSERFDVESEI